MRLRIAQRIGYFLFTLGLVCLPALSGCSHGKAIQVISDFQEALRLTNASGLKRFAIIQGPTSSDQAQVAVLHKLEDRITASLGSELNGVVTWVGPGDRLNATFDGSNWQVSQFVFRGLNPQARYALRISSVAGELLDMRELSVLDTSTRSVKFAVASCMDDSKLNESGDMWEELVSQGPQAIFFLGDNVYADVKAGKMIPADPRSIWERYAETRNAIPLFYAPKLIPIFATWDDHDFGVNNGDRTFPYKDDAKKTFNAFFPQTEIPGVYQRGEGVSSSFLGWQQQFVMMDNRTFRSSLSEKAQTHWGKAQEEWLYKKLKKEGPPTFIMNGDQFFGKYHRFESYEGNHPKSFSSFLATLKRIKPTVVFVSGDRHLTELMEIKPADVGQTTYEITTSAIHAGTYTDGWSKFPNPRKIEGAAGVVNYAIIESEVVGKTALQLTLSAFGPNKMTLYSRKVTVGK